MFLANFYIGAKMLEDYIERKDPSLMKYNNPHSVAIIDRQAMKCRHYPLDLLLSVLPEKLKNGELKDTDILYIVPTGKEYHTRQFHRIKNDKFVATITYETPDNDTEVVRKCGSIIPLWDWLVSEINSLKCQRCNPPTITLSRKLVREFADEF